jgi:hypothetical protein
MSGAKTKPAAEAIRGRLAACINLVEDNSRYPAAISLS